MRSTTIYKWGDILLVGFPLTDASATIRRPGLVLFDEGDEDVMVARISTQSPRSKSDISILDWKNANLIAPSIIRLGKVATIKKTLVVKLLGALSDAEAQRIKGEWQALFP